MILLPAPNIVAEVLLLHVLVQHVEQMLHTQSESFACKIRVFNLLQCKHACANHYT